MYGWCQPPVDRAAARNTLPLPLPGGSISNSARPRAIPRACVSNEEFTRVVLVGFSFFVSPAAAPVPSSAWRGVNDDPGG
jgi:hypothetical protein